MQLAMQICNEHKLDSIATGYQILSHFLLKEHYVVWGTKFKSEEKDLLD